MADCSVSSAPGQTTTSADPESPSAKELQQQVSEVRLCYSFFFLLLLLFLPFSFSSPIFLSVHKTFIPFITISLPSACDPERYPPFLFIFY
jgi:hypothetical protein